MGELIKKAKGKVKQAVGSLTGDKELKRDGEQDELDGKVDGAIDDLRHAVKGAKKDARHALKEVSK